jgi:hypothetical protein
MKIANFILTIWASALTLVAIAGIAIAVFNLITGNIGSTSSFSF